MARELNVLSRIVSLAEHGGWKALREEALQKVAKHEDSVHRLLFRTRQAVDPLEIEYSRGFYQGVMYVLDGIPNQAKAEYERLTKESGNQ